MESGPDYTHGRFDPRGLSTEGLLLQYVFGGARAWRLGLRSYSEGFAVPVEIREVVLRAKLTEGDETSEESQIDLEEFKRDILVECEELIRDTLQRQSER